MPEVETGGGEVTETEVVRQVTDGLRARGYMVFQSHGPMHRPIARGVPDILAVKWGRLLAVEAKSEHGRARPDQLAFMADLRAHGAVAVVARSWDDVEGLLW